MNKINVALLFGGNSSEAEISVKSAEQVASILDTNRFEVYKLKITKSSWYYQDESGLRFDVDKNDFSLPMPDARINFDFALLMIHGDPGENGKMQGYLDLLGIPYSGPGLTASAVGFNKKFSKAVVADLGIGLAPDVFGYKHEKSWLAQQAANLKFPIFVKPNEGGSSFGVTKVKQLSELEPALDLAFNEADSVIIEQGIEGQELSCGAARLNGKVHVFMGTLITTKNEYFDYQAKYVPGYSEEITPPPIDKNVIEDMRMLTEKVYNRLNARGVIRVDFINSNGKLFFLEVNTIPGMSAESIIPKQVRAEGWSVTDFLTQVIEQCIADKS